MVYDCGSSLIVPLPDHHREGLRSFQLNFQEKINDHLSFSYFGDFRYIFILKNILYHYNVMDICTIKRGVGYVN